MATKMRPIQQVTTGIWKLHSLIDAGRGDSPEADEIRDSLDEPWSELTEDEKTIVRSYASDFVDPDNGFRKPGGSASHPTGPPEVGDNVLYRVSQPDLDLIMERCPYWREFDLPEVGDSLAAIVTVVRPDPDMVLLTVFTPAGPVAIRHDLPRGQGLGQWRNYSEDRP